MGEAREDWEQMLAQFLENRTREGLDSKEINTARVETNVNIATTEIITPGLCITYRGPGLCLRRNASHLHHSYISIITYISAPIISTPVSTYSSHPIPISTPSSPSPRFHPHLPPCPPLLQPHHHPHLPPHAHSHLSSSLFPWDHGWDVRVQREQQREQARTKTVPAENRGQIQRRLEGE